MEIKKKKQWTKPEVRELEATPEIMQLFDRRSKEETDPSVKRPDAA